MNENLSSNLIICVYLVHRSFDGEFGLVHIYSYSASS